MQELEIRWADFHEILYSGTLLKFADMFQLPLKSDDSSGHFT
jgi:hypothetical protein